MSAVNEAVILNIEKNNPKVYEAGVEILIRLLDNVIRDPGNTKYRTIILENKLIKDKLLEVEGMLDVLLNIGFVEQQLELHLPSNVILAKIKKYREFIFERLQIKQACLSLNHADVKGRPSKLRQQFAFKTYREKTSFPKVLETQNPFLRSLEEYSDSVMQYNDKELMEYAKSIIPVQKLRYKALEKLRSIQKFIRAGEYKEPEPCIKDLILVELLSWFNKEYFEWIDTLTCKICQQENKIKSVSVEDGIRVEIIKCCSTDTKFYRYNDVAYLLQTRRGRCGEYANCFTFICKCMGYDARHVMATFDHVWTEVYSVAQKRWLHLDPSDNVIDSLLMYQHGWHRRIDYITAFSEDEVQDVTWRYTNNHKNTLSLRQKCTEEELLDTILKLNNKRQKAISQIRRKYIAKRCLKELVELTLEKTVTENEKKGRSSGSLAWRQSRGEKNCNNFFIFEPTELEIAKKQFNIRYSCSQDVYYRYMKDDGVVKIVQSCKSWQACVFSSKHIFRKVERDWKMVYLARQEGTKDGEIQWKFDFSKSNLKIKNFSLELETKTFENGQVSLQILSSEGQPEVIGASGFTITAKATGEEDTWQHAQIFRQSLNSVEYPFDLNVTFY